MKTCYLPMSNPRNCGQGELLKGPLIRRPRRDKTRARGLKRIARITRGLDRVGVLMKSLRRKAANPSLQKMRARRHPGGPAGPLG